MSDLLYKPNNVLIVDDDPILTVIAETYFRKIGSEVIRTAANGRIALEVLKEDPTGIDFILCDLNMPELDGVEFLRHLRYQEFSGRIAILSGEKGAVVRSASNLAVAHELDIVGTLYKPLNVKALYEAVNKTPRREATGLNVPVPVNISGGDLAVAIQCGHIQPYFQPKVDVRNNNTIGAESLARWIHPGFGIIGPDHFIPVAMKNGLIGELTESMVAQTIEALARWRNAGFYIKISVNLTADALRDLEFPDKLAGLTAGAGVPNSSLILEVTEASLLEESQASIETLTRLRIMGFDVSIDDFGTGYSNLEQLRKFPFSELKIDRSFIIEATTDSFARTCVETSVALARELDLRLVAEGVENQEGWDFVIEAGVDEVQGYYIAKPMSADDFSNWLQKNDTDYRYARDRSSQ